MNGMALSTYMMLLVISYAAMIQAANTKAFPCPNDAVISPCTCTGLMGTQPTINISCNAITTRELVQIFSADFLFPQVYETTITGSSLLTLEDNIFGDKILSFLNFVDNLDISFGGNSPFNSSVSSLKSFVLSGTANMRTFDLSYFNNFVSLQSIYMINNPFTEVIGQEVNIPTLVNLTLASNRLVQIPALSKFPALKHLDLSRNMITEIAPNTFDTEARLETVNLEFNSIRTLLANSLKINSFALQHVNLSYNLINTIEPAAFVISDGNPIIDLSYNNLTVLDSAVFLPLLSNMQNSDGKIVVAGNPIVCNCSIAWLILEPNMLVHTAGGRCDGNGPSLEELDPEFFQQFCNGFAKLD